MCHVNQPRIIILVAIPETMVILGFVIAAMILMRG